jgi:hypothetical protein
MMIHRIYIQYLLDIQGSIAALFAPFAEGRSFFLGEYINTRPPLQLKPEL